MSQASQSVEHAHAHQPSVIEANKEFFNNMTSHAHDGEEDSFVEKLLKLPSVQEVYADLTNEILKLYPFDANKTQLLDFACGNGEISRRLSPYCKGITGLDVSEGMINSFKKKMEANGVQNASAVCSELKPDSLNGAKFDVIICLQAYHHMEDCLQITQLLKQFLAPGGALLVADLLKGTQHMPFVLVETQSIMHGLTENSIHSHRMMPHADGFSELEMKEIFEGAGLSGFAFVEAVTRKREDKVYTLFLAKGVN